ncbi:MAG TPA: TrmH family RNA methyltransferase [Clostridia bacterium]|nr:TrmH family RNA methyltransferase [Clostridia bacterium]
MIKLNAKELRTTKADPSKVKNLPKNPIFIVLDDVLDTYNIGSIFRLADAVAAQELIITGRSETPPNSRIKKASVNTTEWVRWRYEETAAQAIKNLIRRFGGKNLQVVAIEQSKESIAYTEIEWKFPVALVVGNETAGVSKEALKEADAIAELPMFGVNISLNVMVSLAIVLYKVVENLD